jgi:hypothetical protein
MPAESARFHRRLRRRDWWFIGLTTIASIIATVAIIAFSEGGTRPGAGRGCFTLERADFMGASTRTYCGKEAATFCLKAPAGDQEIAAKCDAAGLKRPEAS